MELWIRSQDNGLFNPKIIKPPLEDGSIWCYIENTNILLGQYETKERALEVLDEIQDFKDVLIMLESLPQKERKELVKESLKNRETFTYKMPQE